MPNGTWEGGNSVNLLAISHYSHFIDKLLENGITPIVTIYHWDLPNALQEKYNGWLGDEIVEDFANYARLCFKSFGDRVKYWITLNEPDTFADEGYGGGDMAPGITGQQWRARYNSIRAHSLAYQIYKNEFKSSQNGQCGITLSSDWYEPMKNSHEYITAAKLDLAFQLGFWADPIFKTGDFPDEVKSHAGNT